MDQETKPKKVGFIRCQQTEDLCAGSVDFKVASKGIRAFKEIGKCEVVGFVSCGGCPGKKAIPRIQSMIERGAEVISFTSCISLGTPIGFVCPHFEAMKKAALENFKDKVIILDYSH